MTCTTPDPVTDEQRLEAAAAALAHAESIADTDPDRARELVTRAARWTGHLIPHRPPGDRR